MNDNTFTYESFDRQLTNLVTMARAVIDGWDDYGSMEMNLDLKSLTIKAAKLCYMAETDRSMQSDNMIHSRAGANDRLFHLLNDFVNDCLNPFVTRVADRMRAGEGMRGRHTSMIPHSISGILPHIAQLVNSDTKDEIVATTAAFEELMKKQKPTVFPGMTDAERFWLLYELFALVCYLLLHFQTMYDRTHVEIDPDEIGRIILASLQHYAETEEGRAELTRYMEGLRFDHGGMLSEEIIREARIALRKEVPEPLQLCFMQHIHDIDALGRNLLEVKDRSAEDIKALLIVVAKWQLLTRKLDELTKPQLVNLDLPNEVFHDMLHDKRISMKDLRQRIERMLPFINRKNHWFCLWAVLRYHNLIKDANTEAFARQIQSPEWFGATKGLLSFTGDTLREYTGYFTETTFRAWNSQSFNLYRQIHHKTKWSETLCERFLRICYDMDDAFMGRTTT